VLFSRDRHSLQSLHRLWALTALLGVLFLSAFHQFLQDGWGESQADRWLLLAGSALAYLLIVLWRSLPYNRRPGDAALLPRFGWGNSMTLLRGILLAALTGFLFAPWPPDRLAWVPGVLYMLAAVADFLDGYLARVTRLTTRMGELLDMSFDGWGVLVASLLAVQYGQAPVWYLAVALARPAFLFGIRLRTRLHLPVYDLRHSIRRRLFAGLQFGFLFFVLMPVFSPPGTSIAAAVFALPFLVGFLVDWLAVCGIAARQPSAVRRLPALQERLLRWLPLVLRAAAVALLAGQLLRFAGENLPRAEDSFWMLAAGVVMLLLAIGASGRLAAILGLCLLGFQQPAAALTLEMIVLLVVFTAILYLGTGSLSLWQPEERFIYKRAGEPPS
jgi:CDP-diacylglycerol--glycerol-3-phosphate 3-phosphatidyltransferase